MSGMCLCQNAFFCLSVNAFWQVQASSNACTVCLWAGVCAHMNVGKHASFKCLCLDVYLCANVCTCVQVFPLDDIIWPLLASLACTAMGGIDDPSKNSNIYGTWNHFPKGKLWQYVVDTFKITLSMYTHMHCYSLDGEKSTQKYRHMIDWCEHRVEASIKFSAI